MAGVTLGGSTIAAACGIDPFCSPIRLWLRMTGREELERTEAMEWGHRLQPVILAAVAELGGYVLEAPAAPLRDPERPWLVGHPDALARPAVPVPGSPGYLVVEVKAMVRDYDTPAHEAQLQTYLHLAGLRSGLLARLIGLHLDVEPVEHNPRVVAVLLRLAEEFLGYVERDECPPPQGNLDDRAALLLAYPSAEPRRVRETREVRDARRELRLLMERKRAATEREEHLRATLTAYLGSADTLLDAHDAEVATWRQVTSRRFDLEAFKRDHPGLYEEYRTPTTSRTLRLG